MSPRARPKGRASGARPGPGRPDARGTPAREAAPHARPHAGPAGPHEAALRFELLPESSQCGHLLTTADGLVLRINPVAAAWCGRTAAEIEGRLRLIDLLAPGSRFFHQTHYAPLLALQGFAREIAFELRTPGGELRPVLVNAQSVQTAPGSGEPPWVSLVLFEASATRRHERALTSARREAEASAAELVERNAELQAQTERLRVTLQSIADAVVTTDAEGRIDVLNPAALALLGTSVDSLSGQRFDAAVALGRLDDVLPQHSPVQACLRQDRSLHSSGLELLQRADGELRHIEYVVSPLRRDDGSSLGAVWVARDLTEQRRVAERFERDQRHDALTGLPNRAEFERRLAGCSTVLDRQGCGDLLCYLDVDQFKVVNDTAGHVAGDALIRELAHLLQANVRQSDLLARLGGDEFGLLLTGCSVEDGLARAETLRARVAAHRFQWQQLLHAVTVSIGVAPVWRRAGQVTGALSDADVACHTAKDAGRNRVHFAAEADAYIESRRGEMQWVHELRRALAEDRFELFIQPIVPCAAPQAVPTHGELLLRLRGDDGKLVAPGLFVPAAERYQLMGQLDRCVLHKALTWMAKTPAVRCSINVSGQSLGDQGFLPDVMAALVAHGVEPSRVCFEITETAAIANLTAAQRFIATLRGRGARFALDDFGAGLSSFAYLRQLQVDVLKVDGSFVQQMHTDLQNRTIVESIHRVARVSGLRTVAEWVENEAVLAELVKIGVDDAQGYAVGKPMPLSAWGR